MSHLDINTPKGKISLLHEQDAIKIFEKNCQWQYFQTLKDSPCPIDGILIKDGIIRGTVETKCRDLTIDQLSKYDWEWLVTAQKIINCVKISEQLHVPLFGFLYLIPEKKLLMKELWNPKKGFTSNFNVLRSITQATINGGTIERSNAYIKMDDARIFS